MAVDVASTPALLEDLWRQSVTQCDKCGSTQLHRHDDGAQCWECNHIIYMPPAEELENHLRGSAMVESSEPDLKPIEKPENWKKLGQRAKRAWYDEHKEEITRDYNNNSSMSRDAVLKKWGISASTLWLYSKRWGIVSKRKKGPRPAAGNKVDRPLSPKRSEAAVLVITKKDLVNCSDAKFTKLWDIVGRIIRTRTSYKGSEDGE